MEKIFPLFSVMILKRNVFLISEMGWQKEWNEMFKNAKWANTNCTVGQSEIKIQCNLPKFGTLPSIIHRKK